MKKMPVRKNKITIGKRSTICIAILVLFLSFGCGFSVAQADPVISKNNNPIYPVAVSISVVEGAKPLEVTFSLEEVEITRFVPGICAWSFGDGTVKEGAEVHHVYENAGMFSPSVKVRFSNGHDEVVPLPKINVFNEEIMIEAPTPTSTPMPTPTSTTLLRPTRAPTPEPETDTPESEVDTSEGAEVDAPEAEADASEAEVDTPEPTPDPTPTPTRTPTPEPTLAPTPTPEPTPDPTEGFFVMITPNKDSGPTPLQVRFTSITEGGVPLAWKWDFGDGQKSTVEKPAHNYGTSGNYVVQLSVQFLGPVWVDAEPITITVR